MAKALSTIGSQGAIWIGIVVVAALLVRRLDVFVLVAAADVLADLLSFGLKAAVGRHRPTFQPLIAVPHGASFPSGHAATSFACATVLAWRFPRLAVPALLLAAAIAYSRVYNGVHYPLDVIAGALLGAAVATALLLLSRVRRRSRPAPPAG